jgi:uncharacterized protein affecting Mg2+/Co2+ transport
VEQYRGRVHEYQGQGVAGKSPIIKNGTPFEYDSYVEIAEDKGKQ